jgi:pimeloyl-ACP methyl ester carboxylesterase
MSRLTLIKTGFLVSLVLLVLTGCSSAPVADAGPDSTSYSRGDVYLLRGLFNIFSLGMDDINESLAAQGFRAGVYSGTSWRSLARQIADGQAEIPPESLVVISGHSYGADNSIRLARALGKRGVAVDALVLVDPTTPPKIPANVRRCVNIYRSQPSTDWMPWLRGVAVEGEDPSTLIINRDLRMSDENAELSDEVNHFNIEDNPAIQQMVVEEITWIFRQNEIRIAQAKKAGDE